MSVKYENILSVVVFICALIFIFNSGLHSLEEPLERDLTTYGYIGHALLSGEHLYSELWDHKPPGIHIAYAVSELIWGYGQISITFMWIVVTILSSFLIYLILRKISGWPAALLGISFWVLSSNSVHLQANQPNTEIFLNFFTLFAIWALVQSAKPQGQYLHIAGWAMGLSTMFKPITIFLIVPMLLYLILVARRSPEGKNIKEYLRTSITFLYSIPVLWFSMLGYALLSGQFQAYWDILFIYNGQYSGNSLLNIWAFFSNPSFLFSQSLYGVWALVLMSYVWIFIGSQAKRISVPHIFFISIIVGILFEIGSIGRNFSHYFQVLLPIIAINAALLVVFIFEEWRVGKMQRWLLAGALTLLALGTLIDHQVAFFRLSPIQVSHEKYRKQFIDAWEMGLEIKAMTNPDELIYYWGSESGVYYYSQRQSASGIFYNLPLRERKNKSAAAMMTRLLSDLEKNPPAVFIWNTKDGKLEKNRLADFVAGGYYLLGNRSYFNIYVKNI